MPLAYPSPPLPAEDTGCSRLPSTINLLETLVEFYEEEQVWVNHIRAGLMKSTAPIADNQHVDVSEQSSRESLHRSRWVHRFSPSSKPDTRKEHILEQFGQLIEARLESCQRVNELLQQAMVGAPANAMLALTACRDSAMEPQTNSP